MKVFCKYIFKSMIEKKGRLILLLLSIAISTALFVTCSGVMDMAIDSLVKPQLESLENKEIVVSSSKNEMFFSLDKMNKDGIKGIDKEIFVSGTINNNDDEKTYISVRGREESKVKDLNLVKGSLKDFNSKECIISQRISKDKKLKVGDYLKVIIEGESEELKVSAISADEGIFYTDTAKQFSVVVPYKYISKDLHVEGKYNYVAANSKGKNLNKTIKTFNKNNKGKFSCDKLFDRDSVEEGVSAFKTVLYVMLIVVLFVSAIIIYGSFKLIITERLPIIGTFLSQGATKRKVKNILYLESIFYGVLGAVFGNLLGIGGLNLVNRMISPLASYGIYEKLNINYSWLIVGSIFAIVLSIFSAIIPIEKIKKLQVKEVILGTTREKQGRETIKFVIGLIFLGFGIVINFMNSKISESLSGIALFISVVGLILAYPLIVNALSKVLVKFFKGKSRSLYLAINNLATSKVLKGNITLITISLISIMMIMSVGTSLVGVVNGAYEKLNCDISITNISDVRQGEDNLSNILVNKLKEKDYVDKDSINLISDAYASISGKDFRVEGIDIDKYVNYNGYLNLNSSENKKIFNKMKNAKDNELILTNSVAKLLKAKENDEIKIKINGIKKNYKVAGVIDGGLYQGGAFISMKRTDLEKLFNVDSVSIITFKSDKSADKTKKELLKEFKDYGVTMATKAEDSKNDKENNQMIVNILSIFSYIAIIVAALGIINNVTIGFIQRKREIAVLTSVGMKKSSRNFMLLMESIITLIWAGLFSVLYSILGTSLLTKFLKVISMPISVKLDINLIPQNLIAALVIIIIATLPVFIKNKKLSVVEELKYE